MQNETIEKPIVSIDKISGSGRNVRATRKAPMAAGLRVLIVDDNCHIREFMSWALNSMGFEVSQAGNGFEALGMVKPGSFELVMTDLNMPGMDGWMLAQKVKQRSPQTAIVMLTGETPESVNKKIPESCVDSVLFKPCKIEEIEHTILRALDKAPGCLSVEKL